MSLKTGGIALVQEAGPLYAWPYSSRIPYWRNLEYTKYGKFEVAPRRVSRLLVIRRKLCF